VCTVTVVPRPWGFRIVCNRDERYSRPPAEPPAVRRVGGRRTVWPLDPFSGGTWIGANDVGLVMVLLNRTPRQRMPVGDRSGRPAATRQRSRGVIIPSLLGLGCIASALHRTRGLSATEFEPFTLLMVQQSQLAVVRNTGDRVVVRSGVLSRPLMFTSSSLGDHVVERPRRELFARLVAAAALTLRGQAAFHRHRWQDRPEISVCMARPDAATVSRTLVDVDTVRTAVELTHTPIPH
jgi:hypothetical protein